MKTITTTAELADFCAQAANFPYVTVDTEFLRERTYYSKLCLIQLAFMGDGQDERQDLEIFFVDRGIIPAPLFDTQVAAMVCGFGEQAGYETLVRKIAKDSVDKSSRFTDWSRRPLTDAQKSYALADVTHLRVIYEFLSAELDKSGRKKWVAEEMGILNEEAC